MLNSALSSKEDKAQTALTSRDDIDIFQTFLLLKYCMTLHCINIVCFRISVLDTFSKTAHQTKSFTGSIGAADFHAMVVHLSLNSLRTP